MTVATTPKAGGVVLSFPGAASAEMHAQTAVASVLPIAPPVAVPAQSFRVPLHLAGRAPLLPSALARHVPVLQLEVDMSGMPVIMDAAEPTMKELAGARSAVPAPRVGKTRDWVRAQRAYSVLSPVLMEQLRSPDKKSSRPAFWTALVLLSEGVPPAIVEKTFLDSRPDKGSEEILARYDAVIKSPGVADALREVADIGIGLFMRANQLLDPARIGELTQFGKEAERADLAVAGARYIKRIISEGWADAKLWGMLVGPEIEFLASMGTPRALNDLFAGASRTRLYYDLALSYQAAGFRTQFVVRDANGSDVLVDDVPQPETSAAEALPFAFRADQFHRFPTLLKTFSYNGTDVHLRILEGTGGVMVKMQTISQGKSNTVVFSPGADVKSAFDAHAHAFERVAIELGIEALPDEDKLSRAEILERRIDAGEVTLRERNILMLKAMDGDLALVEVTPDSSGRLVLQPLNGRLVTEDGFIMGNATWLAAATFPEAVEEIKAGLFNGALRLVKADRVKGLEVEGYGRVQVLYEEHPLNEIVGDKTLAADMDRVLGPVLDFLAHSEFLGTEDHITVGVHFHGNLPLRNADGRLTVAPMLNVLQEFLPHEQAIYALMPPNRSRRVFIQPLTEAFRERLLASDYIQDPTDVASIFAVFADFAQLTREKYTNVNVDPFIRALGEAILEDGFDEKRGLASGKYHDGQEFETDWHGEHRKFRLRIERHPGFGKEARKQDVLQIEWLRDDGTVTPLLRYSRDAAKNTIEFRFFDTVRSNPRPGVYVIDRPAFMWAGQWVGSLVSMYGNVPFMAEGTMETLRRRAAAQAVGM